MTTSSPQCPHCLCLTAGGCKCGETHRSDGGAARLTYHPEWDKTQPWASYIHGTAGRHFATLSDGKRYMRERGYRFN